MSAFDVAVTIDPRLLKEVGDLGILFVRWITYYIKTALIKVCTFWTTAVVKL
jgi:hypothetical protein